MRRRVRQENYTPPDRAACNASLKPRHGGSPDTVVSAFGPNACDDDESISVTFRPNAETARDTIVRALHVLTGRLAVEQARAELFLIGGAVRCLVHQARAVPKDVDGWFTEPASPHWSGPPRDPWRSHRRLAQRRGEGVSGSARARAPAPTDRDRAVSSGGRRTRRRAPPVRRSPGRIRSRRSSADRACRGWRATASPRRSRS